MKRIIVIIMVFCACSSAMGQEADLPDALKGKEKSIYAGVDAGVSAPPVTINFGGAVGSLKHGRIKVGLTGSFVNTFGSRFEYQKNLFIKHSLISEYGGFFFGSLALENKFRSSYNYFDGVERTKIKIPPHNYLKCEVGFELLNIDNSIQLGLNGGFAYNILLTDVEVTHYEGVKREDLENDIESDIRTPFSIQFSIFLLLRPKRYVPPSN